MDSGKIKALLNEKYWDADKCLIGFEVNEGTGSASGRIADAIAIHLWPSLDYKIIGFEIKISRADWLSEMKQPDKSLALSRFCDEWYLVAPKGVLGIDELPKTWGYIQASENALTTKIKAPQRNPDQVEVPFMASLLRSLVSKYQNKEVLNASIERVREQANKNAEKRFQSAIKRAEEDSQRYRDMVENFHKQTGVYLSSYSVERSIELFNLVKTLEKDDIAKAVQSRIDILKGELASLESISPKALEQLSNFKKTLEMDN